MKRMMIGTVLLGIYSLQAGELGKRGALSLQSMVADTDRLLDALDDIIAEHVESTVSAALTEQDAMIGAAVAQPEQAGSVVTRALCGDGILLDPAQGGSEKDIIGLPAYPRDLVLRDPDGEPILHEPTGDAYKSTQGLLMILRLIKKSVTSPLSAGQQQKLQSMIDRCNGMQSDAQEMKDRLLRLCSLVRQPDVDLFEELTTMYQHNFLRCTHIKFPTDVYRVLGIASPEKLSHKDVSQRIAKMRKQLSDFDIRQLGYIFLNAESKKMLDAYLQGRRAVQDLALTMDEQQCDSLRTQAISLGRIRDEIAKIQRLLREIYPEKAPAAASQE